MEKEGKGEEMEKEGKKGGKMDSPIYNLALV